MKHWLNRKSFRHCAAAGLASAILVTHAAGQEASTNVITAAEDAFGLVIGIESLGLYSEEDVRGFNPLVAGNARLNGLYFDKQGSMTSRLVNDRRIRVGSSAVGFPWPAPTGIVDYTLRGIANEPSLASILYVGPFHGVGLDLDGSVPLGKGGIAAGVAYRDDEPIPDQTRQIAAAGLLPQWRPTQSLELQTFWGKRTVKHNKTLPTIYGSAESLPPRIDVRNFGQEWAEGDSYAEHFGALANAILAQQWILRAGVFHSVSEVNRSFADLYLDTQANGQARHVFVSQPGYFTASTSGEVRVSRAFEGERMKHRLHLGVRTRNVRARYGGSDVVDLGDAFIGRVEPVARPDFSFGPQSADRVTQWAGGISYDLNVPGHFESSLGIQKTSYERRIVHPTQGIARTDEEPWLYNASFSWSPARKVTLFGAATRGLENSGVAPASAINRGEILGASRTDQQEVGIRYQLTKRFNLVGAVFDVRKPYFNFDQAGAYVQVGEERHRGVEMSAAGEVIDGLNVVSGAVFMSPRVTDLTATALNVGSKPVGQTDRVVQFGINYRLPASPAWSLDALVVNRGARTASTDGRVSVPSATTLDVGARYRFRVFDRPATLRVQVANVTDTFSWYVVDANGFQPFEPRRLLAYLSLDL
ncbi:MAG: TonB-dependent receptor [Steroidobacteraceae bacterium]